MSDWRDVMDARSDAAKALADVDAYGSSIEDGRDGDVSLAVLLAAGAVCRELRALGNLIDYAATVKP